MKRTRWIILILIGIIILLGYCLYWGGWRDGHEAGFIQGINGWRDRTLKEQRLDKLLQEMERTREQEERRRGIRGVQA